MNTQSTISRRRANRSGSSAFTLIELLVVITIIAVLAGLLLPVVNSVQTTAKKTSTKSTEMQIVAAVNAYQTDYSQYPVPNTGSTTPTDFTYDTSTNSNHVLLNVLRALNDTSDPTTGSLNAKRTVYFESRNVRNATTPRDGFILTGNPTGNNNVQLVVGDLVDPFGNLYLVRVDANYSNAILNPYSDGWTSSGSDAVSSTTPTTAEQQIQLRTGVVVGTYGPDGQIGDKGNKGSSPWMPTPGDDVVSWQ